MLIFEIMLLIFLIVCATAVALTKKLLPAVLIFMSYSMVMSILWVLIQAPDLALTEAAVGAGITSILFLLVLKRIKALKGEQDEAAPK